MSTVACSGGPASTLRSIMTSNQKNWLLIFGIALPGSIFCVAFLDAFGTSDEHSQLLLRLTARTAFLIYLIVFVARPLRQLFETDMTAWVLRERRSFGLAFATVHLVHLALLIYVADTLAGFEFRFPNDLVGGGVYLLIVLMAITSFDGPARALGTQNWRRLHKAGLYVIGIAFVQTVLPANADELFNPNRIWLVILTAAAISIRLTAFFAKRRGPA